jgi:hypothetical protein
MTDTTVNIETPKYLSRPDAAALIGVSVHTLRWYVRKGLIADVSFTVAYPGVPHGRGEPPRVFLYSDVLALRELREAKLAEPVEPISWKPVNRSRKEGK